MLEAGLALADFQERADSWLKLCGGGLRPLSSMAGRVGRGEGWGTPGVAGARRGCQCSSAARGPALEGGVSRAGCPCCRAGTQGPAPGLGRGAWILQPPLGLRPSRHPKRLHTLCGPRGDCDGGRPQGEDPHGSRGAGGPWPPQRVRVQAGEGMGLVLLEGIGVGGSPGCEPGSREAGASGGGAGGAHRRDPRGPRAARADGELGEDLGALGSSKAGGTAGTHPCARRRLGSRVLLARHRWLLFDT